MKFQSIQKSSTRELVMREILESIETGKFKPGDKLPTEQQLSQMFEVGRSTVREATSTLAALGYLEIVQGRGTFVRADFQPNKPASLALEDIQTAANIIDLVEVREILECSVVRLAAARADREDIERIRQACDNMRRHVDDLNQFTTHDCEFHIALAQASGNRMIQEMMKTIVEKVHQEYEKFEPRPLFQPDKAVSTAEHILACVIQGDGEAAARTMSDHLNLVTTELRGREPEAKRAGKINSAV
jgi:GntR family transcriptional repressor for pyruvate dehydrogenase complex